MTDVRDLELVQAKGWTLISGGAAYNLTLEFAPDLVWVKNYTQYGTVAKLTDHWWMRGMPAGDSLTVQTVDDDGTTGNTTGVLETTNGFTDASSSAGYSSTQKTITGATQANPVVISSTAHGLSDGDRVRITQVTGMLELNDNEYVVANSATNTFALNDAQGNTIDGTGFTAYVSGGQANDLGPTNDVENAAATHIITLGTGVIGANSDVLYVCAMQFPGGILDLGDIG